jgi:hypothetical protein
LNASEFAMVAASAAALGGGEQTKMLALQDAITGERRVRTNDLDVGSAI